MRSSSSPRARWNRLEQAEQAAPPAARRGAERDRGIAFVRAAAPCCQRATLRQYEKGQIQYSITQVVLSLFGLQYESVTILDNVN